MTNTKYQKLKETIQKAVPEIMELGRGCVVELKKPISNAGVITTIIDNVKTIGIYVDAVDTLKVVQKSDIKEILGRPITLPDVLVAIPKSNFILENISLVFTANNQLGFMDIKNGEEAYWNLLKNNLDDQDDPTKEFLANILT